LYQNMAATFLKLFTILEIIRSFLNGLLIWGQRFDHEEMSIFLPDLLY
jgi:hypothetical protein